MHIDDQDVYIRRNIVALSSTVIIVTFLEIPMGQIVQRWLGLSEGHFEPRKVAGLAFAAMLYLIWRLKVSAEGTRFRRRVRAVQGAAMRKLYISDVETWAHNFLNGGREHPYLEGSITKMLYNASDKADENMLRHRGLGSIAFVDIVDAAEFPKLVKLRLRFSMVGSPTFREMKTAFGVLPVHKKHLKKLRSRSNRFVHFSHKLGMDVTVPMIICGIAQWCLLSTLWRVYVQG